jgi:NAD-dependent deacetylase
VSADFSVLFLNKLKNARSVGVLTGAGVSAESGVPTFRDKDGLWQKYRPEDLANLDAFIKDPDFVWNWYQHRREIMNTVKPNSGHYALASMESVFPEFYLVTQNIDNLHSRAGSKNIIELHGNIERNFCIDCKKFYSNISLTEKKVLKCDCGGLIRPDVVWFGEMLPVQELQKAQEVAMNCDVFLTIGTSAEVYPAAMLPIIAKRSGAYVVEINLNKTSISYECDETYQGKSGTILNDLLNLIKI